MTTLYLQGVGDGGGGYTADWTNLEQWFTDPECSTQATGFPVNGDSVVLTQGNLQTGPSPITLASFDCSAGACSTGSTGNITISGSLNFSGLWEGNAAAATSIYFHGGSANYGTLGNNANFEENCSNEGVIGNYLTASNLKQNQGITGDYATISNSNNVCGTFGSHTTFVDTTIGTSDGEPVTVAEYATFTGHSSAQAYFDGSAYSTIIGDYATFTDYAENYGQAGNFSLFSGNAINYGSVGYDTTFTGSSQNLGNPVPPAPIISISGSGGAVTSGVATVVYIQAISQPSPGGVGSGRAIVKIVNAYKTCAVCSLVEWETTGGGVGSGSALISTTACVGGGVGSGSAQIDTNQVYEGMVFCYPLDDEEMPYKDHSANALNSIGGVGAFPSSGVGCFPSSYFDGTSYINLPVDPSRTDHAFSFSAWIKQDQDSNQRLIFSRSNFYVASTFVNGIIADITDNAEEITTVFSDVLDTRWYLVGVKWDRVNLSLFINGKMVSSLSTADTLSPLTGKEQIGLKYEGSLAEMRLYDTALPAAFFSACYSNGCDGGFYSVGNPVICNHSV